MPYFLTKKVKALFSGMAKRLSYYSSAAFKFLHSTLRRVFPEQFINSRTRNLLKAFLCIAFIKCRKKTVFVFQTTLASVCSIRISSVQFKTNLGVNNVMLEKSLKGRQTVMNEYHGYHQASIDRKIRSNFINVHKIHHREQEFISFKDGPGGSWLLRHIRNWQ